MDKILRVNEGREYKMRLAVYWGQNIEKLYLNAVEKRGAQKES